MTRKLFAALATIFLVVLAAGCKDNSNMVTSPAPAPVGTPVPGMPTPTPMPAPHTAMVNVGQGGNNFVDQTSGSSTTTVHAGDTVQWTWVAGFHSTTSGACPGGTCQANGIWDSGTGSSMTFRHTFPQAGSFPYHCAVHGAMMQGTVVVQ